MNRIWIGGVAVVAAIAAMATNPAQSVFTEKARNELIVRQLVQDPAAIAAAAAGKPAFIASKEAVAFPESVARETSRKGPRIFGGDAGEGWSMVRMRIIRHTAAPQIPDTGSFEVRFPNGRASTYFYWDDNPGRRSITRSLSQSEAERAAKELARAEQDKLDG
jgi:hypothetical protein